MCCLTRDRTNDRYTYKNFEVVHGNRTGDANMADDDQLPRLRKKERTRPSLASAFGENLTLAP